MSQCTVPKCMELPGQDGLCLGHAERLADFIYYPACDDGRPPSMEEFVLAWLNSEGIEPPSPSATEAG